MLFLGCNFVSGLLRTLKHKKLKIFKNLSKNLGFLSSPGWKIWKSTFYKEWWNESENLFGHMPNKGWKTDKKWRSVSWKVQTGGEDAGEIARWYTRMVQNGHLYIYRATQKTELWSTRQLSYRKEDRAMRPIYACTEKFSESSLRTRLLFQKFVMDFCSDRY